MGTLSCRPPFPPMGLPIRRRVRFCTVVPPTLLRFQVIVPSLNPRRANVEDVCKRFFVWPPFTRTDRRGRTILVLISHSPLLPPFGRLHCLYSIIFDILSLYLLCLYLAAIPSPCVSLPTETDPFFPLFTEHGSCPLALSHDLPTPTRYPCDVAPSTHELHCTSVLAF